MPLYTLTDVPDLDAPVIVAALEGWVDAGSAGSLAVRQLAADGRVIAQFDTDAIFDYRARRPALDIIDGRPMRLDWSELSLTHRRVGGRDLLILHGPEPDYRWRELASSVVELAKHLGVVSWVSLGAIPAAVPHTRPVPILATASAEGLLPDNIRQGPDGLLRVPAAALSVLELTVSAAGIPSIGLFAQVPHYVNGPYPTAALALLTSLGTFLGVELPVGPLASQALERRKLLDAAAATDEDTRAHVERLEMLADQSMLPAGDELIAEIERFLREGGPDEDPEGGTGAPGSGGSRMN
jgi:proteasome assembly chaperone (PAC2) family protein